MTEYDKSKKDRQDLIDSRRVKISTPDGGAGMSKQEYVAIKPITFKQKWDNYWYHYKFVTFGMTFLVVVLAVFIYQMATKPVYDASLTVLSHYGLDGVSDEWTKNLNTVLKDYTKNGKSEIELQTIQLDPGNEDKMNPQIVQASMAKLAGNLSLMENFLYMVDDATYTYMKESGVTFMDLTSLTDSSQLKDKDKYYIKDTNLSKKLEAGGALDEMYLCFIDYSSLREKVQAKKGVKEAYNKDYAFLKTIFEYK